MQQLRNESVFLQEMQALEKARELVTELRRGHAMQNRFSYGLLDRVDDHLSNEQNRVGTAYFSDVFQGASACR